MFCTLTLITLRRVRFLLFACTFLVGHSLAAGETDDPLSLLNSAEARFILPPDAWFYDTQDALRAEMQIVGAALDAQGMAYAEPWKDHLRWALLEKNLVSLDSINLEEIELARRWMYSNRKGMELPFYAKLRELTDAYLDAAYTFSQPNLETQFKEQVQVARAQCQELIANPTDANAAALGRTLGWFERTRQLMVESAELRAMLSHPNAQVIVSKPLVQKIMSTQSSQVDQVLKVSDSGEAPPTRRFQIPRTVHVRGTARTVGNISLDLIPNDELAELSIVYSGDVDSHCHADAGPVTFNLRTIGPMTARKSVTFDPLGINLKETTVTPSVFTRVTNIQANSQFVRRMGERRINDPQNKSYMSTRARQKAVQLLEDEMDGKVTVAIDDIRAQIQQMRGNASEFAEVFAPVVREGASPVFHSTSSTQEIVAVNIHSQRREQFGAPTPAPLDFADGDVRFRMHVSFLNNMMETIMAGKVFTDEYFMRYAKVLQATLPVPLMVHARSERWAIVAAKPRPLELRIPGPNQFEFALHIASLELSGEKFDGPITATVRYELSKNEFDEYYLERQSDLEVVSTLPSYQREFLHQKLSAFFAPVLDAGGVAIPEGGTLGSLNTLEFLGVKADQDWLVVGINIPQEYVDRTMKAAKENAAPPASEGGLEDQELVLPPPFANDTALSNYPTSN